MRWSIHKKRFDALLAPSLAGRFGVHITRYGERSGRAWLTFDGKEIATFDDIAVEGESDMRRFFCAIADYPQLSLADAFSSENSFVRAFAILDRRMGKRRLVQLAGQVPSGSLDEQLLRLRTVAEREK